MLIAYLPPVSLLVKLGVSADSFNVDALVSGCFKIPEHQNLGRAQTIC